MKTMTFRGETHTAALSRRTSAPSASLRRAPSTFTLLALSMLTACGGKAAGPAAETAGNESAAPATKFTPDETREVIGKPTGPVTVAYRVIGKPVVGQPVAIDLEVRSEIGSKPVTLNYRINDSSAMRLAPSQPDRAALLFDDQRESLARQVMVVPQREGRLFLNVAAEVETDGGTISTVTAVPIRVGAAPAGAGENGTVTTDENGERIRVLPADES